MAPPAPSERAAAKTLPARYAKFITAVLGEAVAYFQLYGATWHLQAALVMAGAALAVLGVPNAPKLAPPAPPAAPPLPSNVSMTPPPPISLPPAGSL